MNFNPKKLPLEETDINKGSLLHSAVKASTELKGMEAKIESANIENSLLLYPLLNQEAAASTRIENTQVTIDDIYEVTTESKKSTQDIDEALNYISALNYGKEFLDETKSFSKTLIKRLHLELMRGNVRGKSKKPGEFKHIENFIGKENSKKSEAEFVPPGPEQTDGLIENLIDYINSDIDDEIIIIKTAIVHAQFETIHPFLDGNGRIGRVLIPLILYFKGFLSEPSFFLSESLEKNKFEYYKRLNDTRWPNNWTSWINYFLEMTTIQAQKNINFVDQWINQRDHMIKILKTKHNHHQISAFSDHVASQPIFKVTKISKDSGISYQSCLSYTKTLEENGLLFSDEKQRNKTYYNYEILNLLR